MPVESIAERWIQVCERVASAAKLSGRQSSDITIIGVSKYADIEQTRQLYEAGCRNFGESRPQSLWEKSDALSELAIRWHMIGHLQRNKSRRTLPLIHCIHSVDSIRLSKQLEIDANELEKEIRVLLEVNVSGDANKTGMLPDQLSEIATSIVQLPHLKVIGLMGMAGLGNSEPKSDFAAIRQLRDQLQIELGSEVPLSELSMGMSGDFETAIAEGSTMVRIGSMLFD